MSYPLSSTDICKLHAERTANFFLILRSIILELYRHNRTPSSTVMESQNLARKTTTNRVLFWCSLVLHIIGYLFAYVACFVCYPLTWIITGVFFSPLYCLPRGKELFHRLHGKIPNLIVRLLSLYGTYCEQSAERFNFEKGKPRRPALKRRRRLSETSPMASIQSSSALLTKFPAEIRLQIYKYAIVGASRHVHIILHKAQRPGGIRHVSKIRSYQCNHDFDSLAMNDFEIHAPAYGNPPLRPYYLPPLPSERGLGPLTLLKTCRQVYLEAIDLLYREQTFTFTSLAQPPFFIHSVLPERLAQIRSIQLIYNQRTMKRICILNTASGLHAHRLQTCPACNLKSWLDSIGWYMKGLRTIEVFIYLRTEMRGLHMDDPWIVRLLKLQQGANGLRDMRIRVYPGACHCGPIHAIEENCPPRRWASELEAWLQEGTERGVEASAKARTHAIDR